MRVAAIDCGTNSIRLLVADVDRRSGTAREVIRRTEVVRLGQGVDAAGMLDPAAITRALSMTQEYARDCAHLGVRRMRFVATSASRDAANAAEFTDGVRAALAPWNCVPEVISGRQEAFLSFTGATSGLREAGMSPPYLVVDVGGGSTELVLGVTGVEREVSLDIGSVRLTERCLHHDPPTAEETAELTRQVDAALRVAQHRLDASPVRTLVGTGGTVTTVAAHALGLARYQRERVHLSRVSIPDVLAACSDLASMPRWRRSALGFMHPGRVDVIAAGALLWRRVVELVAARSGVQFAVTSEHDILDGLALSLA